MFPGLTLVKKKENATLEPARRPVENVQEDLDRVRSFASAWRLL